MAFNKVRKDTETKVLVGLMHEIERDAELTQRGLAKRLGVALGLTNQYLKHVVTKGWVRVSQVSPRRITYFLTPQGFQEKSRMVAGYLKNSLSLYREARHECTQLIAVIRQRGWGLIGVVGTGDLADIVMLVLKSEGVSYKQLSPQDNLSTVDAVLIADIENPQGTYDAAVAVIAAQRVLCLDLLHIRQHPTPVSSG